MGAPTDPAGPPQYRVYRSRKPLLPRRDGGDQDGLVGLPDGARPPPPGRRPRLSRGAIVRWLLLGLLGWIALSIVCFLVSAQIQQGKIEQQVDRALGGAGYPLSSPNNILVLGSDQRSADTAEPGASTSGPSRSDSILLVRTGGGANARLSIARDTVVDIAGAGRQQINAAFAIGGSALAVTTVEQYTGIDVHHVVVMSFDDFPALIDAMGGITYRGGCVVSRINGGFQNGGYTLRLPAGQSRIDGRQALALARTRKNACARNEDDRTRARRQQKIFAAMKRRLLSPAAFVRLPFVSWRAPRAIRSDMSGPTLLGVFGALALAGTPEMQVLGTFDGRVPDAAKRVAVQRFLAG
jgi:LCP family protein required for cell wall assembly